LRRLSVRLVELTTAEGISIAKLPAERHEATATNVLRAIAKAADQPRPTFVTDPLLMTVEERTMLICAYLAQCTEDGPDFAIGKSKLSNYLALECDSTQDETSLGKVIKNEMVLRPLLGVHTQAMELICHERGDWIIAAMACQIFQKDEPSPDYLSLSPTALQQWIKERSERLTALPESDFDRIYRAFFEGRARLFHFVRYGFDDDGVICLAHEKGAGDVQHAPARFLANTCISEVSRELSGEPD
jgi:hypothetical protein